MCLRNITKIVDLNVAMDAFDAFAIAAGVASSIPFYRCSFVCVRGLLIGEFAIWVYVSRFEDYLVSLWARYRQEIFIWTRKLLLLHTGAKLPADLWHSQVLRRRRWFGGQLRWWPVFIPQAFWLLASLPGFVLYLWFFKIERDFWRCAQCTLILAISFLFFSAVLVLVSSTPLLNKPPVLRQLNHWTGLEVFWFQGYADRISTLL